MEFLYTIAVFTTTLIITKRYNRITNITRAYVYIIIRRRLAGSSDFNCLQCILPGINYRSIFYHLFVQIDDILLCQLAANRSSMNKRNERGKNKEDINNLLLRLVAIRH